MDWHIESLISATLRTHPRTAEFLLKNLGAERVVAAARAILKDAFVLDQTKIDELFAEIEELRTERNEVLHWIWGRTEQENIAMHLSARPFRKQQHKFKTAADIQTLADRAVTAIEALIWWENEISSRLQPPSLGKPEPQSPPPSSPASSEPNP
jgi:hypothetical protein